MTRTLDIDGRPWLGIERQCRCGDMRVDQSDRAGRVQGLLVTHGLALCQVPYGRTIG